MVIHGDTTVIHGDTRPLLTKYESFLSIYKVYQGDNFVEIIFRATQKASLDNLSCFHRSK